MNDETLRRVRLYFLRSAAVILIVTGGAKLFSITGSSELLNHDDPLLLLPNRYLMVATGILELFVAGFALFGTNAKFGVRSILILATTFLVYRSGLEWIEYEKPCSCLGELTDALGLSREQADMVSSASLMYLLLGSYGLFGWNLFVGWRGEPLELQEESV